MDVCCAMRGVPAFLASRRWIIPLHPLHPTKVHLVGISCFSAHKAILVGLPPRILHLVLFMLSFSSFLYDCIHLPAVEPCHLNSFRTPCSHYLSIARHISLVLKYNMMLSQHIIFALATLPSTLINCSWAFVWQTKPLNFLSSFLLLVWWLRNMFARKGGYMLCKLFFSFDRK